jgi:hypothetical protein
MARDVFISYSKEDKVWADRVCTALANVGISYWIAPRDIPPGQEWPVAIVAGIKRSSNLVLILSSHSSNSKQIAREVETADRHRLNMVSFRVEDVQPPESLEFFLHNIQWLDALGDHFDDAVLRLIGMIQTGKKFPAERTQISRSPNLGNLEKPPPAPTNRSMAARLGSSKALWAAGGAALLLLALSYFAFGRRDADPADPVTTKIESAGLVVAGTGASRYTVYDDAGKKVQGVRKPVTVREGQRASLTSGTLVVAGAGASTCAVYDAAGKKVLGAGMTKTVFELFPGNYIVELQSVRKPVTVREGQQASLAAGTLVVAGTGASTCAVYDAAGKKVLSAGMTKTVFELFPGNYVVELQGVRKPVKVRESRQASLTSGTLTVAGTGGSSYSVYDAHGKQLLGSGMTNVAFDLFPGKYVVELQGVRKVVTVRPGSKASAR